jgi:hypothetical protein
LECGGRDGRHDIHPNGLGRFDGFTEAEEVIILDEIDRMVDCRPIEKVLKGNCKKKASADGGPAYPALLATWGTMKQQLLITE